MPSLNDKSRRTAIEKALEVAQQSRDTERHRIPWKDSNLTCAVVTLDLDMVLLNPKSHRIRAQLSSHNKKTLVDQDPGAEEAQEILATLLRQTEGYQEIKASLLEEGQLNPGVITREGVLINANTRAVALRDLEKDYIRVLVLPPNVGSKQIAELELRLQVRQELKQDYTFTNELLFISECLQTGWTPERVAREAHYIARHGPKKGVDKVKQTQRILDTIEELRRMSQDRISYPAFDAQKQALIDLDDDYQSMKASKPEEAIRMRTARLVGIMAGMKYRDLRHVNSDFFSRFLKPQLEDNQELADYGAQLFGDGESMSDPEGLELLGGGPADQAGEAEHLLNWFTRTAGHNEVKFKVRNVTISRSRDAVIKSLLESMTDAAEDAKDDGKRDDLVEYPAQRIREARSKLRRALEAFHEAKTDKRFDNSHFGKLQYEINKLQKRAAEMADAVQKESDRRANSQIPAGH